MFCKDDNLKTKDLVIILLLPSLNHTHTNLLIHMVTKGQMVKKRLLQLGLVICIILLIIIGINLMKSTNKGTPDQEKKGNPLKQNSSSSAAEKR